jgi:hypothetical protein
MENKTTPTTDSKAPVQPVLKVWTTPKFEQIEFVETNASFLPSSSFDFAFGPGRSSV